MSSADVLRVAALLAFGYATSLPPTWSTVASSIGIVSLIASLDVRRKAEPVNSRVVKWIVGLAALALVGMGIFRGATDYPDAASWVSSIWLVMITLGAIGAVAIGLGKSRVLRITLVGLVAFLVLGVMVQYADDPVGLDVMRSHVSAADALRQGLHPYGDAVRVADGSPNASPGDEIVGYSYPPVTLVGYTGFETVLGDARWLSALSILGLAAMATSRRRAVSLFAVLAFAAVPLLRGFVWSGWTEPLTAVLFAGSAVALPTTWGFVLLALGLASKQYLAFLAPLVLSAFWSSRRRLVMLAAVLVVAVGVAFLGDPRLAWNALVLRPAGLGFRPDTQSIAGALAAFGLSVEIPLAITAVVVAVLGVWLGRRVKTSADLMAASAACLAILFAMSIAFPNYWFLIVALVYVSLVIPERSLVEVSHPDGAEQ